VYETMKAEGRGHVAIAERLNELGIPSPRGKSWHHSTVARHFDPHQRAHWRTYIAQRRAHIAAEDWWPRS
jgi:hypothetical protein